MAVNSQVALRVSRFLSYTVIAMSSIMKLPQVFAILQAGNSTGLNVKAYWMDLTACLIGFSYGYAHGYHLTTYMEAGLIAIQVSIIIFLVILYDRKWTLENGLYTLLCAVYIVISSLKLLPHPLFSVLLSSTLPLAVLSKLTHIRTLYQIKSRGSVSMLMWLLDTYLCVVRLFTVYVEVGDLLILASFFIALIQDLTIIFMLVLW